MKMLFTFPYISVVLCNPNEHCYNFVKHAFTNYKYVRK